ncbi:MAG: septum formation initiator family protein [Anaerolineae bacterium]
MPAQLQTLSLSRLGRLRRQELVKRHVLRLICFGLVALSLAGLLYLTQASSVTTTTYEIQELQNEIQRLQRRRDRLRAEIAELTAPEHIEARAHALGFRASPPAEFLVVTEVPMMAQRPAMTSPPEKTATPLETLLARASTWVQTAMSLLPAPRQVEAGPAHQ